MTTPDVDVPLSVDFRDGKLLVEGDGIAFAISPQAAIKTGERLLEAAKLSPLAEGGAGNAGESTQ